MTKILKLFAALMVCASVAHADVYDGVSKSTVTGKATRNLSGVLVIASSITTQGTAKITLDGTNGVTTLVPIMADDITVGGELSMLPGSTLTIDGAAAISISAAPTFTDLSVTYGVQSATTVITNTGAGALDVAGGINAGTGNVGIVDATGKIPALSSTYLASLSGAALTGIAAANIAAGSLGAEVIASSIAAGAIKSEQLDSSLTIGATMTAAAFNVTGSGQVALGNTTSLLIVDLVPYQAHGATVFNATIDAVCYSTSAVAGSWVLPRGPAVDSALVPCW